MFRSLVLSSLILLTLAGGMGSAADKESDVAFFETKIRPLLIEQCVRCHGEKKQEGELRLDQFTGIAKGGATGPVIVAGKPDQSLLMLAVRQESNDLKMPPDKKLTEPQIADLRRWIELGLPHPDKDKPPTTPQPEKLAVELRGRDHWSFQPIQEVPPPVSESSANRLNEVDAFLQASLAEHNLHPAAAADRRTLLRRVTYDLTGLPPTAEEIHEFQTDDRPDAFARVVDRLLAHPAYGEHWGRHWLDVARYADSNGLDENIAHGNAWRYRDYVIAAWNADKPWNQFVTEQLAGDLLTAATPSERNTNLIATGLLSIGPKVLAEPDKKKMEMDIIDEQLDTVGRAFLGLTLGCARCHDHKFDPLRIADYYALAGVFKSTHTMESLVTIAKWHENPLADGEYDQRLAEHEGKVKPLKQQEAELITAANAKLQVELGEGVALPAKPEEKYPDATKADLKKVRDELAAVEKTRPQQPAAMGVKEATPVDLQVHLRGSHLALGETVPRKFPAVLFTGKTVAVASPTSGRLELANWLTASEQPLTSRVFVNRVWNWHFGRGLVPSTDNFGLLGEKPTHPALLDWLAANFVREGWSVKQLHRRLLNSAAYQRSGEVPLAERERDPENQWLARFAMRRLTAEEIRDSILAVSHGLDRQPGGPSLRTENRKHIFDHTSKDDTTYVHHRRSAYLPIVRNHLCDVFTLFDYADDSVSTSQRVSSTVSSQALFLLNSELLLDAAERVAALGLAAEGTDEERISAVYEQLLGRAPQPREVTRAVSFLREIEAKSAAKRDGWRLLAQSLLMSNEFLYVR